jgi:hypothetical protein
MIKEMSHVVYTDSKIFLDELSRDLKNHDGLIPEIQYQMSTLPNGRIQYGALILYR